MDLGWRRGGIHEGLRVAHVQIWQDGVESIMRLVFIVPFPTLALALSFRRSVDDQWLESLGGVFAVCCLDSRVIPGICRKSASGRRQQIQPCVYAYFRRSPLRCWVEGSTAPKKKT